MEEPTSFLTQREASASGVRTRRVIRVTPRPAAISSRYEDPGGMDSGAIQQGIPAPAREAEISWAMASWREL
jgi:hypothetical protein